MFRLSCPQNPVRDVIIDNVLDGLVFCGECGHRMTQATKNNKNGPRFLLRCSNHFSHPEECKHNHSIYYDELAAIVEKDLIHYLQTVEIMENAAIQLTRSAVLQWIDYIEIGSNMNDDSAIQNRVSIHYREVDKAKRKCRNRKPYGFI